jgi:hypothetical protein
VKTWARNGADAVANCSTREMSADFPNPARV